MKFIATIFLFFIFLIASFTKSIVWLYYQYNLDFIKKELCVNKDKPKLNCNGKCYLSKQIKKTEKNDNKLPQSLKNLKEITLYLFKTLNYCFIPFEYFNFINFKEVLKFNLNSKIFTPPKII